MKKIILFTMLLVSGLTYSQSMLGKGGKQLNAGFGMSSWGLPIYVGVDFGVHEDVSLGVEASFRSYRDRWGGIYYNHSVMGFSGNVNYHFNTLLKMPQEFDLYAGLNVGFYIWNSPSNYYGSHTSGLGYGGQIGFRYYFNSKFAINLEGGSGNAFSGGKLGITYKF
ncbi:MAG: hypothetical protein K0R65_945 [Crocinitomicaceae bacterium]|jgi:hypothetical protein|nr:hypothetical protein [Crocinitomicaceae bacterium]